jgi:hypothetical protein
MLAEGYPAEISEIYDIEDNTARGRIDYRGVESFAIDTNVTLESRIVWPFDGDALSRRTITIEGTAYAEEGVQLVEISTDGGSSWLLATGTDYWTYSFTPVVDGLQEFRCRVTDNDSNVETTPDAVTVDFDFTLPTTEGTLPASETWSGTIDLTGDVIVPAGMTLTIDPGTTVRIQPLADNIRGGVDTSRIELIVQGDLVAQGSGPGSILMTSGSVTPAKNHWYGIRYTGVSRPLTELRGLSLEWGVRGLSDTDSIGVPDLDGIDIQQMSQEGILTSGSLADNDNWTLRDLRISLVGSYGLRFNTGSAFSSITLEDATIEDVGHEAFSGVVTLGQGVAVTVRDSTFDTSAGQKAVYLYGASDILIERATVHQSNASANAVYIQTVDNLTIDDCEITGGNRSINTYKVLYPTIRRSRITDGTIGVYLKGYGSRQEDALLENNRISDTSGDGVYVDSGATATLHYNDLYNISGYTLNNQTASAIDAADNYWGEDTETEMDAKGCDANIDAIYDWYDNGARGKVTYCGYATDPFGDQPTIFLHEDAGQYQIHWNPKADLEYDLIRGDVANLAIAGDTVDLGAVTCEEQANGSGVITDTSPDPAAQQCWFYLLRDHTTPGTYGNDSAGRTRIPASGDCP